MAKKEDFSLKVTAPKIGGGRVSGSEKLTSSFDLVEQMYFLYVRLLKARNLLLNNTSGDAFVEIRIGNYKATTKYLPRTNLEWNQVFAFAKDKLQDTVVHITLKDPVNEAIIIGKRLITLAEIPTRVPPDGSLAPKWYALVDMKDERVPAELNFSIWMGTQEDEFYPSAWHSEATNVSGECIINTRSTVYQMPKLCYIRVNIIQAQDLIPGDKNNKNPEVYVQGHILGNKTVLKSTVSPKKSLNPTWNEDLMFVATEPLDDYLVLNVMNKLGGGKEECLGTFKTKLSGIFARTAPAPVTAKWYKLDPPGLMEGRGNQQNFSSKLNMRICSDQGYHVFDESIHYSSDYRPYSKSLWTPQIGVLEVGILNASGLLPTKLRDGRGSTDAYCVAKYGLKWVKTRTVVDSLAPKWNEQSSWEVYDPHTVITIGVFDNCNLQGVGLPGGVRDAIIGKVRIRLSTLETDRIYTLSYPLVVIQPNGVKKAGEIQLAVRFTCPSMRIMLQAYIRPLLPKMHYVHPLSVKQLEELRKQAIDITALNLSRAEPPLRKEVVDYMLDVSSNMWSMRRGKATFERLVTSCNGVVLAWKWFDDVRKWKNVYVTVMIHLLYLIVFFKPGLVLPTLCYACFFWGLWQYRKRPRIPPHMDDKLAKVDTALPDELDEEFDTFPTSRPADVLKMRYDRLRLIAARGIVVICDLVNQVERVQALLSWRDPRATFVFVGFCLVAGTLMFMIPLTLLIGFLGFYVIRHPIFRIDIPSIPQNFFRRLSTRQDSMF